MTKRQEIREALKNMLLDNTDVGSNVFTNRVSAFWREEFPCISIFMKDESSSPRNLSTRATVRTGSLIIQVINEATEDLDNSLDTIAEQIESIIDTDPSLTATVQSCILTDSEIELSGEVSTKPIGSLTLVYEIKYLKN